MVLLESLKIKSGKPAQKFSLKGVDERIYTLENFADAKILVIVFMCNHCPYVQAVWQRLIDLQARFIDRNVQFVGINSNVANPDYSEDNFENMKIEYDRRKMNFPYLTDEIQSVARAYEAQCTPDIFVYDSDRKLAYHGRVDDNWKDPDKVSKQELAEAIEALLRGDRPSLEQHPSMGCSIKFLE